MPKSLSFIGLVGKYYSTTYNFIGFSPGYTSVGGAYPSI
jgi:hypothetical protein